MFTPPMLASHFGYLPFACVQEHEAFTSSLPHITLKDGHVKDVYLCSKLKDALEGTNLYAHCPHAPEDSLVQDRILREAKVSERAVFIKSD